MGGKSVNLDVSRVSATRERFEKEIHKVCDEFCSCPTELTGPAESPDSVYRTKHNDSCERKRFVDAIWQATTADMDELLRLLGEFDTPTSWFDSEMHSCNYCHANNEGKIVHQPDCLISRNRAVLARYGKS